MHAKVPSMKPLSHPNVKELLEQTIIFLTENFIKNVK